MRAQGKKLALLDNIATLTNTKQMKQVFRTCFLLALTSCFAQQAAEAQEGKIAGLPTALSVHEGQIFEIAYFVNPGIEPVSVVDFVLNYDPEYLEALSIDRVDSPLDINQINAEIKADKGKVYYGAFKLKSPWPTEPFQLVKVRFKALKEVERTMLDHPVEETPYTSMAFEGRNTMAIAATTEIQIYRKEMDNGPLSKLEKTSLKVDSESDPSRIVITFTVNEAISSKLILRQKNGNQLGILYDHRAFPGIPYRIEIDSTVLTVGSYQIELVSPDGVYSSEFSTAGS